MKEENRQKRHEAIAASAYVSLAEHGYGGSSMLRIAKAARASNETLYRWYGDKDGLFLQMVQDNAANIRDMLEVAISDATDPFEALSELAPVLLKMLLGEHAVLLNRAAAADSTGRLGAAISAGGRGTVMPLISRLMERISAGKTCSASEAAGWYVNLLIGDWQIRRAIGGMAEPSDEQIAARCAEALRSFRVLLDAA
ncbi:TetR/AcrR family transcriptional regulator [Paracoccus aerodenitrificans]|uniref:TetR/AcrR family transcriptional regulator n=1 Tax=Paracoccus aerodenitrificans TaxID=3017781 RepID=UPI0022F024D5|nr:TetR/AcrR family transcriptional regulator [Paracoccus aerodenitrificans]WBU63048.1 TetR/AcrR family transcriptional regulator [Paracoccus aerodenitrificans]